MIKTLKIEDIGAREDVTVVMSMVQDFLNSCDPDDRADLKISVAFR